jgi:glyoxylase-like metal-dependent hydrolase (beta-lactamase superfamily II)
VSARLEAIDRDPRKIDLVINSHFHFDHVGGNALIPNATLLVQRREWDAGMDPDSAARRGFDPPGSLLEEPRVCRLAAGGNLRRRPAK